MQAKDNLIKITGKKRVFKNNELLKSFATDHSFVSGKNPSLVIKPETVDQVKQIVQIANEKSVKLIPVSSKPPRFRGDTIPASDETVIVDLSDLKKIMWVNRRNRVALVETGVTFDEFEKEIEKQGMRTMMPLAPRSTKSVVGAFMERDPFTAIKYSWDSGDPVASTEIVLGDGYTTRTGGAAGPAPTLEKQREVGGAQKLPISPISLDIKRIAQGSQGGIGICTWMAIRCELLPEYEKVYFIESDDLEKLIACMKRFVYLRIIDEGYILNKLNFACLLGKDEADILNLKNEIPEWVLVVTIAGMGELPKEMFDYKNADILEEVKKLNLKLSEKMGTVGEEEYRKKIIRKVSEPYWKLRFKGDCRELFFLSSMTKINEFVTAVQKFAKNYNFDFSNIGIYIQPIVHGTACHVEFDIYASSGDMPSLEKMFNEASAVLFEMGAFYSRPYGIWADIVYPEYGTYAKYARGLKNIFDPNNIMNPGKLCFKE